MTKAEKLGALVQYAIDHKWKSPSKKFHVSDWNSEVGERLDNDWIRYGVWFDEPAPLGNIFHWQDIVYRHDFVRALFGEEELVVNPSTFGRLTRVHMGLPVESPKPSQLEALLIHACDYRLQQAVTAKDPLGYMYKAVFGE